MRRLAYDRLTDCRDAAAVLTFFAMASVDFGIAYRLLSALWLMG